MPVHRIFARRALAVIIVALALPGAIYAAYWFHVAGELRKGIETWAAERRAAGWMVDWAEMETGGFPGPVRVRLSQPHLTRPDGLDWRAEALTASAPPVNLTHVTLLAPGRHDVAWAGRAASLTAASLNAKLNFGPDGRLREAGLAAAGLHLVEAGGAARTANALEIAGLSLTLLPSRQPAVTLDSESLRFAAAAHGIILPEIPGLVLEREIAVAELTGRVLGPLPAGPPAAAFAAWSAGGGTVEIDSLALDWAPMALEAEGTLALDPRGQPLAALSARIRGFAELMDRLADRRVLDAGAATAAKLMLSLMAKPDARGRPAVPVPVTLQDGGLWLGPARLADIPPLPFAPAR